MLGLLQDIIELKPWCQPSAMLELRGRRRAVASFWFQQEWGKSGTRFQVAPLEGLLGNVYVRFGVLDIVGWMVWNWSYQLPVHKGDAGSTTVGV